jgi:hypothetical protein
VWNCSLEEYYRCQGGGGRVQKHDHGNVKTPERAKPFTYVDSDGHTRERNTNRILKYADDDDNDKDDKKDKKDSNTVTTGPVAQARMAELPEDF